MNHAHRTKTWYCVCCDCQQCQEECPGGFIDHGGYATQREARAELKACRASGHTSCYLAISVTKPLALLPQRKPKKRKAA